MKIPEQTDFDEWSAGKIGDAGLTRVEAFFAEMLSGAEALGPRYSLATMALRAEYNAAHSMLSRRREPIEAHAVTGPSGDGIPHN